MSIDEQVIRLAKRVAEEFRKLRAPVLELGTLTKRVVALEARPVTEGEAGAKGDKGDQGVTGATGAAGASGAATLEVHTLELATLPACGVVSSAIAHTCAAIPTYVVGQFVCVTTDLGYTAGEVIQHSAVKLDSGAGSADHGDAWTAVFDATNIYLIGAIGSAPVVRQAPHRTTGVVGTFDPTKWKWRVSALRHF